MFMKYTRQDAFSILVNGCPWHRILSLWGLKQKTAESKTEFCLIESLSLQCKLCTGRKCRGSFTTLSLSHWYHWLCRPNHVNL